MNTEKSKFLKIVCLSIIFLGLGGVALTFTIGSFVTLVLMGGYILIRYPKRAKALVLVIILGILFPIVLTLMVKDTGRYWKEMSKLSNPGESGTGGERLFLWKIALREFTDHPVFGVGLNNFGYYAPRMATDSEVQAARLRWNYSGNLWGFSLHNSHLQVLCELGIVGIFLYVFLFLDFFKKNRFIKRISKTPNGLKNQIVKQPSAKNVENMGVNFALPLALESSLVVYLIAGNFYGILFYPDFWIILITNTLLYASLNKPGSYDNTSNSYSKPRPLSTL